MQIYLRFPKTQTMLDKKDETNKKPWIQPPLPQINVET